MTRLPFDASKTAAARALNTPPEELLPGEQAGEAVGGAAGTGGPVRTVKQINAIIQGVLAQHLPATVWVQGEVSNFRTYDRGHAFFTLKEAGAELPCIMWKDALTRLKFRPGDGLEVVARGSIKMYEAQGKVQLYVEGLEPRGVGGLELAFRQLCEKLKAEGLFEAARKRPIPLLPQRIVVITSRTGDVLHDVLTTAYRRYPGLHTMLYAVPVQGAAAAPKIVEAIKAVNASAKSLGGIDVILLVRGGGSLEDLWAFNEESVARAIVASKIPVATGIGHEPDMTVADLVGDLRGPTPTGVTELTIPDVAGLSKEIDAMAVLLGRDLRRTLEAAQADVQRRRLELAGALRETVRMRRTEMDGLAKSIARIEPRHAIAQGWRRVEEAGRTLEHAAEIRLRQEQERLTRLERRLEKLSPLEKMRRCADHAEHLSKKLQTALRTRLAAAQQKVQALGQELRIVSPHAVLDRGFSITRTGSGKVVRSKDDVQKGDVITTHVADGEFRSTVGEPRQGKLF